MKIYLNNFQKLFSPHFLPLLNNTNKYLIAYGGTGSGKSWSIAQKFIYRCLYSIQINKPETFLVVMKTRETLKKAAFEQLKRLIFEYNCDSLCRITESPMKIRWKNGTEIWFTGLDKPDRQLKSVPGISSVWCEEADQLTPDDLRQLNIRMRGCCPTYNQIVLTFNPISTNHWIKKTFFDRIVENCHIDKSTYLDNPYLQKDHDWIRELENYKETCPLYYQVYCLGMWGVLSETIYTNWKVIETPKEIYNNSSIQNYGLDFGYNAPTACLKVAKKENDIFILSEYYQKHKTTSDLIIDFDTQSSGTQLQKKLYMYADRSEPDRIEEFFRAGYNIYPARNEVKTGIDWLKSKNIFVDKSCVNTIEELESYSYKKVGDEILDEPIKKYDHCMDALRYACSDWITNPAYEIKYQSVGRRATASRALNYF